MSAQQAYPTQYAIRASEAAYIRFSEAIASSPELSAFSTFRRQAAKVWSVAQRWLALHAFAPPWLPQRWRHPLMGYLAAAVLQMLLTACDLLLLLRYPDLTTHHIFLVLGVVIAALSWGVGPSLVATLTGTILLYSVVLFTPLSWPQATETDVAELILFLLICGAISALSGQTQRARLKAEQARRAAEHLAASLAQEHARSELERQRLQAVLEVLPVGVCMVNTAGEVLTRNQADRAIWGYGPPNGIAQEGAEPRQGWWASTGQRILPDEWGLARALRHGEETRGQEIIVQADNGHPHTFLSAAVPIQGTDGAIVGAVAAMLDITKRKQLEESLRQAEREQLEIARKEAELQALVLREANQRMDAFLGIVSHELKTPLTTLKLQMQLFHRRLGRLPSHVSKSAEEMAGELKSLQAHSLRSLYQVDRLDRLVNDLLDLSRIQAGKLELREEHADLRAIIRDTVEEQRHLAPQRSLRLQPLPEQPIPIQGDAERIGQVVTNYLTNALKYSLENRPVEIGVQIEEKQARVWVRDEGAGIPSEEHTQIWERFHRVPGMKVVSGSGIGLGLGLYISRTIVERHGGQVGVESTPGAGSTFWFTLPLAREEAEAGE
jgi:PAS domain S-box-containing protein